MPYSGSSIISRSVRTPSLRQTMLALPLMAAILAEVSCGSETGNNGGSGGTGGDTNIGASCAGVDLPVKGTFTQPEETVNACKANIEVCPDAAVLCNGGPFTNLTQGCKDVIQSWELGGNACQPDACTGACCMDNCTVVED